MIILAREIRARLTRSRYETPLFWNGTPCARNTHQTFQGANDQEQGLPASPGRIRKRFGGSVRAAFREMVGAKRRETDRNERREQISLVFQAASPPATRPRPQSHPNNTSSHSQERKRIPVFHQLGPSPARAGTGQSKKPVMNRNARSLCDHSVSPGTEDEDPELQDREDRDTVLGPRTVNREGEVVLQETASVLSAGGPWRAARSPSTPVQGTHSHPPRREGFSQPEPPNVQMSTRASLRRRAELPDDNACSKG